MDCGDAVIGINPAADSLPVIVTLLNMVDEFRAHYEVPAQSCVLTAWLTLESLGF
jgi:ethanolamine ammonia-lyase large subunit